MLPMPDWFKHAVTNLLASAAQCLYFRIFWRIREG
jgi:hypothetical protein